MIPSQLEHLKLIDAHCERLLTIAAKRTPGEWKAATETVWTRHERICGDAETDDATFIASCAGNAEAGWRATKAAIKSLLALTHVPQVDASDEYLTCCEHYAKDAHDALESILSAWPIEMLTK